MSKLTDTSNGNLYESEWWNRLSAISEKGISRAPEARVETKVERKGVLHALSSMLDLILGERLSTSIVKMN
jgi:hypothetical protein